VARAIALACSKVAIVAIVAIMMLVGVEGNTKFTVRRRIIATGGQQCSDFQEDGSCCC